MSHVAFLIPTIDRIGGAERQVLLLARQFARRGWRVSLVALAGSGADASHDLSSAGIRFFSLEMRKGLADPRGWLRFHHWILREKPEILHAHLPHAAMLARWSRIIAPVPVVIDTIHTSATGPLLRRFGYRVSAFLPDRVSAVSAAAAYAWISAGIVRSSSLTIVPNGIDIDEWKVDPLVRSTTRNMLGMNGSFLWFAAGRLDPVKNYSALLHSFAHLPSNATLAIAGDGPQDSDLQKLAHSLGIASRVLFLGFQKDILPWMQSADGFVQASLWEGLPMAILEAGACELPAVATDVPGTREAIRHGTTGLLASPDDESKLEAAMSQLMQMSPAARGAMGRCARHFVGERFSLSSVIDQWEALYRDSLSRCSSHAARAEKQNIEPSV